MRDRVRTRADQALSIFVPDDGVAMRPSRYNVEKNVEDFGYGKGYVKAVARCEALLLAKR